MKKDIKIPAMGESITEVVIGSIFISSGSAVKADQEILEIETDKVNQVLYAPQAGILNLTVKTGQTVKIGETIGTVDSAGAKEEVKKTAEEKKEEIPLKKPVEEKKIEEKKPQQQPVEKADLRLTKEKFIEELKAEKLPTEEAHKEMAPISPRVVTEEKETRRRMSTLRKTIAMRLVEAQRTAAMLTTFNEIDLSQVIVLREKYKDPFIKKYGVKLGFMSFFVKACVSALKLFPDLNSYIEGEEIVHREYYNIGVAVGTEKGVIVPVIRDCDGLSFAEIEKIIEGFAKKAREGTLGIDSLKGAGFTITNGGIYGSLLSTPILVPPQTGILGMHKIEKRPVVIEDQIAIRSMMYVALSYDHRLIDGKEAVSFLVHIKEVLEDPSRLALEI